MDLCLSNCQNLLTGNRPLSEQRSNQTELQDLILIKYTPFIKLLKWQNLELTRITLIKTF